MNEKIITFKHFKSFVEYFKRKLSEKADKSDIPTSLPANGGNADTVGGKSAEELTQSNPNLLINPDFKINQSGKTEYLPNADAYSADRWFISTKAKVSVEGDGVKITATAETDRGWLVIAQRMEPPLTVGKTYTISFYVNEIVGTSWYFDYNEAKYGILTGGLHTFTFVAKEHSNPNNGGANAPLIAFGKNHAVGDSIVIKWMKLEEGSVATPFIPPNPMTEILKCQPISHKEGKLLNGAGKWVDIPSNPNLLDNPDFKINQRGKSEYQSQNNNSVRSADRWSCLPHWFKAVVTDNALTAVLTSKITTMNAETALLQNVEYDPSCGRRECVASIFVEDISPGNNIYGLVSGRLNNTGKVYSKNVDLNIGLNTINLKGLTDECNRLRLSIVFRPTSNVGDFIKIKWAKLEYGSKATPFIPPDPALELLKCQRYCVALHGDLGRNYTANTNTFYFNLAIPVPMRINPSFEHTDLKIKVYGTGDTRNDFTYTCFTKGSPPNLHIQATKQSHGIPVNPGAVLMSGTTDTILSADL